METNVKAKRLNQVIALVAGQKTRAEQLLTKTHQGWKDGGLTGFTRTYKPADDEGEQLPPESKRVETTVVRELRRVVEQSTDYFDLVATQEEGNTVARADVIVDGQTVLASVSVTTLLFLEKRLEDLRTFVAKLPTLPLDKAWHWDANSGQYRTEPETTRKTAKVPKTHVKFEPTEHQPGQAEIYMTDELVGHWDTVHFSGALPVEDRDILLGKVEALQGAVKLAREEANTHEVAGANIGKPVLSHVFGSLLKESTV